MGLVQCGFYCDFLDVSVYKKLYHIENIYRGLFNISVFMNFLGLRISKFHITLTTVKKYIASMDSNMCFKCIDDMKDFTHKEHFTCLLEECWCVSLCLFKEGNCLNALLQIAHTWGFSAV